MKGIEKKVHARLKGQQKKWERCGQTLKEDILASLTDTQLINDWEKEAGCAVAKLGFQSSVALQHVEKSHRKGLNLTKRTAKRKHGKKLWSASPRTMEI